MSRCPSGIKAAPRIRTFAGPGPFATQTNLCSPVQNCRKFSAVFGATSANSSILMRPAGRPPSVTSAHASIIIQNINQLVTTPHAAKSLESAGTIASPPRWETTLQYGHARVPTEEDDWIFGVGLTEMPLGLVCFCHGCLPAAARSACRPAKCAALLPKCQDGVPSLRP